MGKPQPKCFPEFIEGLETPQALLALPSEEARSGGLRGVVLGYWKITWKLLCYVALYSNMRVMLGFNWNNGK